MAAKDQRFTHESLQDAKTVKTLLNSLAKGFSKGEMTLGDDDNEMSLAVEGLLNVRIKAEREDGQCAFSLRVSWSDPSEPPLPKGTPRVR